MKPKYDFDKIDGSPEMIEWPEDVIRDLSTDQNLLYKRCLAAITYVQSEHGLEGELLERLRTHIHCDILLPNVVPDQGETLLARSSKTCSV